MSTAPLSSILIVGGGSAGWMAAAYLSRMLRRQRVAVTLVESPDIGTIGVGESTIPSMVRFVRSLGLDEAEFMRRCSGSYKLAIRFSDWLETGTDYWHPFGPVGPRVAGNDLFHYWFARREAGTRPPPYPEHSLQYWLAAGMKGPRSLNGGSTISEQGGYAFHVDAGALAAYLREIAISEGVTHIQGQVGKVDLGPDGSIAAVDIGGGRTLSADLYIDCTGFRGVLIEGALGDQWIDWNNQMLNDRAVVMPVSRGDVVPSYTHSTAIPEGGWVWQIALSSRVGTGYVHSSAHLDETRAAEILVERAGPTRSRLADPRLLRMRIGRRSKFWVKNCISIGLAAGFVEPLESTGLHTTQRGFELLFEYLPGAAILPQLRDRYNQHMGLVFDQVRDFILLHYYLTRRGEAYWRDARAVPLSSSLEEMLALYDEFGQIEPVDGHVFADTSYYLIMDGNRRYPRRPHPRTALAPPMEMDRMLSGLRQQNIAAADTLPPLVDLLDVIHPAKI